MIIPSIDLMNGHAVQLVGGKAERMQVDAGDPVPIAEQFRIAGEIAVVDLDAALGKGDNVEVMKKLCRIAKCRVGGGIRSVDSALMWLNLGATKVVLGTAATPEVCSQLPKNRVIAALDADRGEVVVKGWTSKTGRSVFECVEELKPYVAGFLVTFVEREGRMGGVDMEAIKKLKDVVGSDHELTIAGGVRVVEEIAELDRLNIHAQVGMALYTHAMDLGDAISAPLISDRQDGLFPTVVVNEHKQALGLVYSSKESIREAVKLKKGVYHSRKRGLWYKGESSGATQDLLAISLDCDRDALTFVVRQLGDGFCHLPRFSCFGKSSGLTALMGTIEQRKTDAPSGSYTRRLFDDDTLLNAKILEEAKELTEAKSKEEITGEAADVIYFALVAASKNGVSLSDIEAELDFRALKVSRRKGDAKPQFLEQASQSTQPSALSTPTHPTSL
jgi:phosphoribosyl-AMP cyclohydrolase / phosphoribosyl-ATP pyrophosphohydrolase